MILQKTEHRTLLTRATAGDIFRHNGHDFNVVGVSRYRTEDGRTRLVVTLAAHCEMCGGTYQVTTGRAPTWIPRTCQVHRGRGARRGCAAGATMPQETSIGPGRVPAAATAENVVRAPAGAKRCARCGKVKTAEDFYRHRHRTDGLDGYCKNCRKQKTSRARKDRQRRGLCVDCGRDAGGARYCLDCLEKRNDHKNGIAVKPVQTARACSTCGKVKPVSEFYRRAWGPSSECKVCMIQRQAARSSHWRKLGLCGRCGGRVENGAASCPRCLERRRPKPSLHRTSPADAAERNVEPTRGHTGDRPCPVRT